MNGDEWERENKKRGENARCGQEKIGRERFRNKRDGEEDNERLRDEMRAKDAWKMKKKKHIEYLSANNVFDQDRISCAFHNFHLLPFPIYHTSSHTTSSMSFPSVGNLILIRIKSYLWYTIIKLISIDQSRVVSNVPKKNTFLQFNYMFN